MEITGWDERYRTGARAKEDLESAPNPLLVNTAKQLPPKKALDLACGAGRNALWLAQQGWSVTAVDGSPVAIEILRNRATQLAIALDSKVADLEKGQYRIEPKTWDLIAICYYLQRDLLEPAKQGVIPGGILLAIVHITEPGEEPTAHRLKPGELQTFFKDWKILHYYEGKPNDTSHHRSVAEIVAQRPLDSP